MVNEKGRKHREFDTKNARSRVVVVMGGGYVPPHLRRTTTTTTKAAAASPSSSSTQKTTTTTLTPPNDDLDTGGGHQSRKTHLLNDEEEEEEERKCFGGFDEKSAAALVRPPLQQRVVKKKWQPSERVLKLTRKQVEEMRARLNVIATAPEEEEDEDDDSVVYAPIESFEDMKLDREIALSIKAHGFDKPTPIQAQGIPVILSGCDVLGCAETGSGKTAAFSIPMIHYCVSMSDAYGATRRGDGPTAIVLAPTRELAQQIEKETKAFSQSIDKRRFETAIVVGGSSMSEQRGDLRNGVECVVATPGRLIDHIHQNNTNLRRTSFLVLDEADRLLDMGFEQQILEILNTTPKPRQTLLFSATMPPEVEDLAGKYLVKPVKVKVGTVSAPTANVSQSLEKVPNGNAKIDRLCRMVVEEKMESVAHGNAPPMSIVFVERKAKAEDVADMLNAEGVATASLHGGRTQGEREAALRDFTRGLCSVLVATDVAARGLDVKGVQHVINMDLPRSFEDYVHRIGRTGRNGMTGRATSFYTDSDAFIISQIKRALQELENGNAFAFATGKEARAREKEAQRAWKEERSADQSKKETDSGGIISVDDKFKSMLVTSANANASQSGAADDAWGSDDDDF